MTGSPSWKQEYLEIQSHYYDAYVRFRERSTLPSLPFEKYQIQKSRSIRVRWLKVSMYSADFLRELRNSIQLLRANIHRLEAWSEVLQNISEPRLPWILEESVVPLAYHALSVPYALRDRFIYCTSFLLHLTANFLTGGAEPYWDDRKIRRKSLREKPQTSHAVALNLDLAPFAELVDRICENGSKIDELRNRSIHRLPPNIEFGVATTLVRSENDGHVGYGFGGDTAIRLHELTPLLMYEHAKSVEAFEAFHGMVRDIFDKLSQSEENTGYDALVTN